MRSRFLRLAAVLVFAVWFLALRPQILGGPAGWILVAGQSMEPSIHAGTLVVVMRQSEYQIGEVVAYRVPDTDPGAGSNVIHRIVGGTAEAGFVMRGDNTNGPDIWRPRPADVVGAAWLVVPGAAPILLFLRSPIVAASFATGVATYLVLGLAGAVPVDPAERTPRSRPVRGPLIKRPRPLRP
jgi:signal peptidase